MACACILTDPLTIFYFTGALITLKQYATQDDIITLNDVRNIEKLLTLATPDQKPELIQTLTENRYMARVPSNLYVSCDFFVFCFVCVLRPEFFY